MIRKRLLARGGSLPRSQCSLRSWEHRDGFTRGRTCSDFDKQGVRGNPTPSRPALGPGPLRRGSGIHPTRVRPGTPTARAHRWRGFCSFHLLAGEGASLERVGLCEGVAQKRWGRGIGPPEAGSPAEARSVPEIHLFRSIRARWLCYCRSGREACRSRSPWQRATIKTPAGLLQDPKLPRRAAALRLAANSPTKGGTTCTGPALHP